MGHRHQERWPSPINVLIKGFVNLPFSRIRCWGGGGKGQVGGKLPEADGAGQVAGVRISIHRDGTIAPIAGEARVALEGWQGPVEINTIPTSRNLLIIGQAGALAQNQAQVLSFQDIEMGIGGRQREVAAKPRCQAQVGASLIFSDHRSKSV